MDYEHIIALLADLQRTKRQPTDGEAEHVEKTGSPAEIAVLGQLTRTNEKLKGSPTPQDLNYTLSLTLEEEATAEEVRGVYRRIHNYRSTN